MKQIIFFLFPVLLYSQKEISFDTFYVSKDAKNKYFLTTIVTYSDSTSEVKREMLGDSATVVNYFTVQMERESNRMANHAKELILKSQVNKKFNDYNNIVKQITGKQVFDILNKQYGSKYVGNYKLIKEDTITQGEIVQLNSGNLQFKPDTGNGILLKIWRNQIRLFEINKGFVDLYEYVDGKYSSIDGLIKLIRKE